MKIKPSVNSNLMDMEIAGTENSVVDFIPHSQANNPGATNIYQQMGRGINHQIMEDQFRDDIVVDMVDNST